MGKYDTLKIENQLCFPLYAASREIIKRYKPHLDKLDLTYTQYITMMVIWEKRSISVKELGEVLFLDSGTLTPVLKKLEAKGYITRHRSEKDERVLIVSVTDEGTRLRDEALTVPQAVGRCVRLKKDEADALYKLLYTIINTLEEE